MNKQLKAYLNPLLRRVRMMVTRAVVEMIDNKTLMQRVQITGLDGELRWAERPQEYGFTSTPLPPEDTKTAEAIVVGVGGNRGHPLVIALGDRRFRIDLTDEGDVAIYDFRGQYVALCKDKIQMYSPTKIECVTPLLEVPEGDVVASGFSFLKHFHAGVAPGSSATLTPTPTEPIAPTEPLKLKEAGNA